jgi:hypothetical protein
MAMQRRALHQVAERPTDVYPSPDVYQGLLQLPGVELRTVSRFLNAASFIVPDSLVPVIAQMPECARIQPVRRFKAQHPVENRTTIAGSWFDAHYGLSNRPMEISDGHLLHQSGLTGKGVLIAVIDAGFYNLPAYEPFRHLIDSGRVMATYDFIGWENDVYNDDAHGMQVMSVVAGYDPGQLIGAAYNADYLLLRSEDATAEYILEEDRWVQAAEFADQQGARIILSSLGYTTFDDTATSHLYADLDGNTTVISRAADIAAAQGILVVVAAGNAGSGAWKYIGVPADADSVIAVGAVDRLGNRAGFSSVGPTADGRVKPDAMAVGDGAAVFNLYTGNAGLGAGTSFAAPLVAGLSACLMEAFPDLTSFQLTDLIRQFGHQSAIPDSLMGYGITDFTGIYCHLAGTCGLPVIWNSAAADNPVGFGVFLPESGDSEVNLFDASGKLMYTWKGTLEQGRLLVSLFQCFPVLRSGVYILQVVVNKNSITKKVMLLSP